MLNLLIISWLIGWSLGSVLLFCRTFFLFWLRKRLLLFLRSKWFYAFSEVRVFCAYLCNRHNRRKIHVFIERCHVWCNLELHALPFMDQKFSCQKDFHQTTEQVHMNPSVTSNIISDSKMGNPAEVQSWTAASVRRTPEVQTEQPDSFSFYLKLQNPKQLRENTLAVIVTAPLL
jgi:hypothetical protein